MVNCEPGQPCTCSNTAPVTETPEREVTCRLPTMFPLFLNTASTTNNCTEGEQILYNTSCLYDCEVGYNLTGNSTVTCLENGDLSSELPKCGILQCYLPSFSDGLISPNITCDERTYTNYSDSCYFECDVGFDLIGNDTVTCGEDALLSADLPTCQVVICPLPEVFDSNLLLEFGNCSQGGSIDFNTLCTFECSEGYALIGNESVSCQSNGTLSAVLPTCKVESCSIPELPAHLLAMTSQCNGSKSINYTETCSYSCDIGYNRIGSESVTCLANTSLSDFLPTCEVVTCHLPDVFHPNLSSVFNENCNEGSSIDFDATCTFECSEGYDLIGSESVTCLNDGSLSESVPKCNVVSCSIPELPSQLSAMTSQCNGSQSINYTDTCSYSCHEGYNLTGSNLVTCRANAALSPSLPTCTVVTCPLPRVFPSFLYNTTTTNNCGEGEQILYSTSCSYNCKNGYNLTGNSTVTCLKNGDLSSDLPRCAKTEKVVGSPSKNFRTVVVSVISGVCGAATLILLFCIAKVAYRNHHNQSNQKTVKEATSAQTEDQGVMYSLPGPVDGIGLGYLVNAPSEVSSVQYTDQKKWYTEEWLRIANNDSGLYSSESQNATTTLPGITTVV
ncbi:P-selectin-like [Lytechinus variegatus]|uniref:P-selectin-like n=1 Tax=Lytechinus variegatus TaxID=7654 RepID=UPI001BB26C35|nr:P-selectin-like [Lytechinus variegatus]